MIINNDDSEKLNYDNPDDPIFRKYCVLSSYPGYAAPSHWHDDIELIVVLSGNMQYNINGEIITLYEGEGLFVNSRQMHFGFSSAKEECIFLCVLLHPLLLCTTASYERDFVLPVLNHGDLPFIHFYREISWHQEILKKIQWICDIKKESAAPLKIQTAFLSIWVLLYEHMPPIVKTNTHAAGDLTLVKNMMGFIQQNYQKKISLSDIAASGLIGQSKCCKLFSKYLSQTPGLYLTRYRLNKSILLLKNTEKTITEIAIECGFGSSSYYAETFRKWIGETPTTYRKK